MAYKIKVNMCTGCEACLPACGVNDAIFESRLPDLEECMSCDVCEGFNCDIFCDGKKIYVIDANRCTECIESNHSPRCVEVCPVDQCCVPDPAYQETKEQLLDKWKRLFPGENISTNN